MQGGHREIFIGTMQLATEAMRRKFVVSLRGAVKLATLRQCMTFDSARAQDERFILCLNTLEHEDAKDEIRVEVAQGLDIS